MKKFLNFLNNIFSPRPSSSTTDKLFANWDLLDFDVLLKHFNVKQEAIEKGKLNSPAKSSTFDDDFHGRLKQRYKKLIGDRTREINRRFEALETQATNANADVIFFDNAEQEFSNQLRSDRENIEPELKSLKGQVLDLRQQIVEFKDRNKLTREANYPESKLWYIFILLLMIVLESAINGILFQTGAVYGYLGGVSIAVLISAVNVVLGFFVGAMIGKQAFSIHQPQKAVGYLGFATWGVITMGFNLAVGHVRFLYEQGVTESAFNVGFENFLASPFGLTDFYSWVLVIVGIFFATVALFDGLNIDDAYPGYGKITRKLKKAEEDYYGEIQELEDESEALYKTYKDKGDTAVANLIQEEISLRENHSFLKERVYNEYPYYCDYYTDMFKRLIGVYREHNLEAREDEGPAYFADSIDLNWDRDNRDEQLKNISLEIDRISKRLIHLQDDWEKERKVLEDFKLEFVTSLRNDYGIS